MKPAIESVVDDATGACDIDPTHPSVSSAWAVSSRRVPLVCDRHSCLINCADDSGDALVDLGGRLPVGRCEGWAGVPFLEVASGRLDVNAGFFHSVRAVRGSWGAWRTRAGAPGPPFRCRHSAAPAIDPDAVRSISLVPATLPTNLQK
jgi:hypothetical protein